MNILTAISISKLCQGLQSSFSFDIRETDLTSMRSSISETDLTSISLTFHTTINARTEIWQINLQSKKQRTNTK